MNWSLQYKFCTVFRILLCVFEVYGKFPFQDTSLPWDKRVDDLLGRLTLQELIDQGSAIYFHDPIGVPRLDIKPYQYITECLRGYTDRNATAFPEALGLAATFNRSLIFEMSTMISDEVRAYYNTDVKRGVFGKNGLTCLSPVINIMRHPLWGRSQETYGEDPYLTGELVTQYVKGLQGAHSKYVKAHATCKHFDAYAGPESCSFDVKVSERDLRMTFLPQFKACVKAGTYNVMCSYNRLNGVPACANKKLMTDILRDEWGFKGFIISDDEALEFMVSLHHYVDDYVQAAAAAIKAGLNVELTESAAVYKSIPEAISRGLLSKEEVVESMRPVFNARMRLGEFDPPEMNPYSTIDMSVVLSPAHQEAAVQAATMSFVLLKNINFLPLKKTYSRIAFIGPMANDPNELFGGYTPNPDSKFVTTPFMGLKRLSNNVVLEPGCDTHCDTYEKQKVQMAITGSDLIIVCLGNGIHIEAEAKDRSSLDLPGQQLQILKDAISFGSGAPVLLLIFTAGPVDLSFAMKSQGVDAILQCFYPAMSTGEALYRTITNTGPHSVPAGRLPSTWPANLQQIAAITDYNMTHHQTYRYFEGDPLFPFGYGLSYSRFYYDSMMVTPQRLKAGDNVTVIVNVNNYGPYVADEVVQLYMSWVNSSVPVPRWTLVGFERVTVVVSQPQKVKFFVSAEQMAVWLDDKHGYTVLPGDMVLYVGGQQPYQKINVGSNVLQTKFTITT